MNNKGFMMAELVIVSSIIMVTLVGLYTSYGKIFTVYNQRINYYDVATLYELSYIRDNTDFNELVSKSVVVDEDYEKVYLVDKDDLLELEVTNQTFKEYLEFVSTSTQFQTDSILVMERCLNSDIDNCRYAYLEVFDNETSQ